MVRGGVGFHYKDYTPCLPLNWNSTNSDSLVPFIEICLGEVHPNIICFLILHLLFQLD